jgi:hypothetical protein
MSEDEVASQSAQGEGDNAPEPRDPEDMHTQPFALLKDADREARRRRRGVLAELAVRRPRRKEVRLSLDRGTTTIGRDPRCDIVLDDEGTSRRHASIERGERGYYELVDLKSKNGTLVEGLPIARMLLLDGDVFAIGDTRFTLHLSERPEEG